MTSLHGPGLKFFRLFVECYCRLCRTRNIFSYHPTRKYSFRFIPQTPQQREEDVDICALIFADMRVWKTCSECSVTQWTGRDGG